MLRKAKKGITNQLRFEFPISETHYIGIGSAGLKAIEKIAEKNLNGIYSYIGITKPTNLPDNINFYQVNIENKLAISEGLYGSLLTAEPRELQKLSSILDDGNRFALMVGCGGFNSSLTACYLAKIISNKSKDTIAYLQMPTQKEGSVNQQISLRTARIISQYCKVRSHSLDEINKKSNFSTEIELYKEADEYFYRHVTTAA